MGLFSLGKITSIFQNLRDPLYRNSVFISLSRFSEMGFGFLFWLVAARFYSVNDVGEATTIISSLSLVLMLSRFGFDATQIRFMNDYEKEVVFNTCLWIPAIGAVIIGGVYFAFLRYITPASAFIHGYFLPFVLVALLSSIIATTANAFVSLGKPEHRFIQNLLLGVRIPALFVFVSLGSIGIFLSYGFACLIGVIFAAWLIVRFIPIRFQIDKDFTRETSRFTYLGYFSTIFQTIPVLIMPILILSLSNAGNAALYYIAFAFGSLVLVIPDAIGMSFFVEGSQGAPVKKSIIRAFIVTFIILIPAVLFLWFFGENILQWLGKDYTGAIDLMRIFIVSGIFTSIYQLFLYLEGVRLEPEVAFIFNIIRALLIIPLSYEFLIIFGIIGVAWAWMLGHVIICIIILWYMRTHILREIKNPSVFTP